MIEVGSTLGLKEIVSVVTTPVAATVTAAEQVPEEMGLVGIAAVPERMVSVKVPEVVGRVRVGVPAAAPTVTVAVPDDDPDKARIPEPVPEVWKVGAVIPAAPVAVIPPEPV